MARKPGRNSRAAVRTRLVTEWAFSPIYGGAAVAQEFAKPMVPETGFGDAVDLLTEAAAKVKSGDLSDLETMLTAQAYMLNAAFVALTWKSAPSIGQHPHAIEQRMRLAYKAQAQCRATIETLAEIKHPRSLAFVKQANIAHGPQQVNNQIEAEHRAPAEGTQNRTNELLEMSHGERLDTGTAGAPGSACQELETVEKLNGAEICRRQSG